VVVANLQHPIEEILEERAGTMRVGISQGGALGSGRQAQMPQLAFTGG
jgi:hypothetical protein